jgi:hypothetical protein
MKSTMANSHKQRFANGRRSDDCYRPKYLDNLAEDRPPSQLCGLSDQSVRRLHVSARRCSTELSPVDAPPLNLQAEELRGSCAAAESDARSSPAHGAAFFALANQHMR